MTEQEWLNCSDPLAMLTFLNRKASGRKRRLFAVACCRRIWHLFTEEGYRETVLAVERCADQPAANYAACRVPAIAAAKRLRRNHASIGLVYYAALGSAYSLAREAALESANQAAASLALSLADEARKTRDVQ